MTPESPLLVSVRALTKCYGTTLAVDGMDLAVAAGEIVGLLGPNGAGKTTTLECLLGLRTPDTGHILVAGIDVCVSPCEALRRVGAQIQPATLQDKITPREALTFFASFYDAPAAIHELLTRFALIEKADAPFDSLSSGQRQRLCVALAFVNRPALLVLDEPTTGLDPQARRALHHILDDHRSAGGGVLLSTHDLDEAQRLCDRVVIIHRGRIVATGTPAELIADTGAATHFLFHTTQPLAAETLASLPAVLPRSEVRQNFVRPEARLPRSEDREAHRRAPATHHRLRSTEPARTIAALTAVLQAEHNELLALEVRPPTLEDAFIALTGEGWDTTPEADA